MVSGLSGMRIIALPLTSQAISSSRASSSNLPLTYYHFQTPPQKDYKRQQSIVKRVIAKATDIWAGFGKAPENNWKRRVFVYGERLADRVDFEELSLKGIDPSLGPRMGATRGVEKVNSLAKIPLHYPPSHGFWHDSASSPLSHIQALLSKRAPHHKKGFYVWLGIAPLTMPFILIPVIPNLPFFYAAWRAWSHYRAWKASQYLQSLIDSNRVVPQPNPQLDEVYTTSRYDSPSRSTADNPSPAKELVADFQSHWFPRHDLLLDREAIPRILEIFNLSESTGREILRAIEQAKLRIKKDDDS